MIEITLSLLEMADAARVPPPSPRNPEGRRQVAPFDNDPELLAMTPLPDSDCVGTGLELHVVGSGSGAEADSLARRMRAMPFVNVTPQDDSHSKSPSRSRWFKGSTPLTSLTTVPSPSLKS